ncbi:hypothetical protein RHMOL_Rhmol01G0146100 [Rhododendron molle]|uniref:Uncharacterized protein n=1 Tax=Rhododendron molle TaxID=49168 RepID=A0ACC0Q188_RHOML|nr:hypothetical protein RHMOL_Rhmol01G0146100 [Rhododendron molle]
MKKSINKKSTADSHPFSHPKTPVNTGAQNLNHHNNHTSPYNNPDCFPRPKKLQPHQGANLCAVQSNEERADLITTMELQEDQTKKHMLRKIETRSTQADCSGEEDRKKPLSLGINVPQARATLMPSDSPFELSFFFQVGQQLRLHRLRIPPRDVQLKLGNKLIQFSSLSLSLSSLFFQQNTLMYNFVKIKVVNNYASLIKKISTRSVPFSLSIF